MILKRFLNTLSNTVMFLSCSQLTDLLRLLILKCINSVPALRQYSKTLPMILIPLCGFGIVCLIFYVLESTCE